MKTMVRRITPRGWYVIALCVLYVAIVALGIHTSSIGQVTEEGPAPSGIIYGTPKAIRSDEYLRSSPAQIGWRRFVRRVGIAPDRVMSTPLDATYPLADLGVGRPSPLPTGRGLSWIVDKIKNPDTAVIHKLPIPNDFAALWWRGTLYTFLGMAMLFGVLGLSWKWSAVASLMVFFSPANQWWSYWPLESTGVALLSCGLLATALARASAQIDSDSTVRRLRSTAWNVLLLAAAGVLGLRLPSAYQPWSFAVCITVGAVFIGMVVGRRFAFAKTKWYLLGGGVVALVAVIPIVNRLRNSLGSMLQTVYPGERRFTGLTGYPRWGSALNWELQRAASAAVNQSELSIGLVVLIVPVFIVLVAGRRHRHSPLYWPLVLGTTAVSVFYLWTAVSWPAWLSSVTFLERIPPDRTLQIIGVIIPILYVLSIAFAQGGAVEERSRKAVVAVTLVTVVVLTLQDGSMLRGSLPWVGVGALWATAVASGLLISLPLAGRFVRSSVTVLTLAVVLSGANVNPVMQGLGYLGRSSSQRALADAISQDDRRWASDSFVIDVAATAAGMRLLSGNQGTGPNLRAYGLLDPPSFDENKWNRAGSYVTFSWTEGPDIVFANPSFDVVQIQIDPCNPVLDEFDLAWVASSGDQPNPCLSLVRTFPFQGMTIRLYHRAN